MKNKDTITKIVHLTVIGILVVVTLETMPIQTSASTSHLVINELYYNHLDWYEAAQWVEIYNPTGSPVDISRWVLRYDEIKGVNVFPSGTTIDPGEFLIVTHDSTAFQTLFPDVPSGTQIFDDDLMGENFAALPTGTLRLTDGNANTVDHLFYGGEPGAAPFVEPPNSVARYKGAYDTGDCSNDFYVETAPTSGSENLQEPPTGTLTVSTTPVDGDIYVNGQYKGTGDHSGTYNVGTYTVSFGSVSGYYTPAPKQATVYGGQETEVTGVYTPEQPPPEGVGGVMVPIDKLGLLAPYIGLVSIILVATAAIAIYAKRIKLRKKKQ